jgi:hypothetical protein
MSNAGTLQAVSDYDGELDTLLFFVANGHVKGPGELTHRMSTVAEEHSVCVSDMLRDLGGRLQRHIQAGEYTEEMVRGIPSSLHPLLGVNVDPSV